MTAHDQFAAAMALPFDCIRCAHAHTSTYACPNRDLTGQARCCPRHYGWVPLGYLPPDVLTATTAEEHAAEILTLPSHQQLEQVMGTDIATTAKKFATQLATIESAAEEYAGMMAADNGSAMMRTLAKATAISIIEESLTDELLRRSVVPLMGKKFGFRTDRDREQKPYPLTTIRSCVCEVLLHGARLDGNEFNIIAGQAYFTREFWTRKVEELGDVSAIDIKVGEVEVKPRKGFSREASDAYVEVIATWVVKRTPREWRKTIERQHGREFDNRVVVPMNAQMGRDAIIGKVMARTYKAIYQLSGGAYLEASADGEEPVADVIDVESTAVETPAPMADEDPQDMADNQARLLDEYLTLIAAADTKEAVESLVKTAGDDAALTKQTLDVINSAARQRWHAISKG